MSASPMCKRDSAADELAWMLIAPMESTSTTGDGSVVRMESLVAAMFPIWREAVLYVETSYYSVVAAPLLVLKKLATIRMLGTL